MAVIKDTRRVKEHIKHGQHKDDGSKIVGVSAASVAAAGGGTVAAMGTTTTVTGASIAGLLEIGGGVGSWLLAHGIGTAVVATTATFSLPVFLGIAIPALGVATGFTLLKNWQNNRDIKDFNTTVDIDTLGEKIAESVFYPVVYFLRSLRVKKEAIKENLVKDMVKDYGFDEEWARCFLFNATEWRLESLKSKIANQDVAIVIDIGGKEKKTRDLNVKDLRKRAVKLCEQAVSQSCYAISDEKAVQAKDTIRYMEKYLFKGKNYSF